MDSSVPAAPVVITYRNDLRPAPWRLEFMLIFLTRFNDLTRIFQKLRTMCKHTIEAVMQFFYDIDNCRVRDVPWHNCMQCDEPWSVPRSLGGQLAIKRNVKNISTLSNLSYFSFGHLLRHLRRRIDTNTTNTLIFARICSSRVDYRCFVSYCVSTEISTSKEYWVWVL